MVYYMVFFQTFLEEMNDQIRSYDRHDRWIPEHDRHVLSIMDQTSHHTSPNRGHLSALLGTEALRPGASRS